MIEIYGEKIGDRYFLRNWKSEINDFVRDDSFLDFLMDLDFDFHICGSFIPWLLTGKNSSDINYSESDLDILIGNKKIFQFIQKISEIFKIKNKVFIFSDKTNINKMDAENFDEIVESENKITLTASNLSTNYSETFIDINKIYVKSIIIISDKARKIDVGSYYSDDQFDDFMFPFLRCKISREGLFMERSAMKYYFENVLGDVHYHSDGKTSLKKIMEKYEKRGFEI